MRESIAVRLARLQDGTAGDVWPFGVTIRCDYLHDGKTKATRCQNLATHRSDTAARCELHGGHLDFTERWDGTAWQPTVLESPARRSE